MKREQDGQIYGHDLPHELLMDNLGIELSDLSAHLRAKIRLLDKTMERALKDGYVDEKEEQTIISQSYTISLEIEEQFKDRNNNSGTTVGIVAGIALLIGAAFGIKQLNQ